MTRISDETLMAYGDGELDPDQTEVVRSALRRDHDLRRRLEHSQAIDEQLRDAFAPELDVPDRFAATLRPAPSVGSFATKRSPGFGGSWLAAGTAIAAGVAGLVAGSLLTSSTPDWLKRVDDGIAVAGALQMIVRHTPSGQFEQAGSFGVTPILSFVAADGRMCREVRLSDDEMAARIVACKGAGEDEWGVEAFARMPLPGSTSAYRTAGTPKDPVIDAAYSRLGVKSTLDATAERAAIAGGWRQE